MCKCVKNFVDFNQVHSIKCESVDDAVGKLGNLTPQKINNKLKQPLIVEPFLFSHTIKGCFSEFFVSDIFGYLSFPWFEYRSLFHDFSNIILDIFCQSSVKSDMLLFAFLQFRYFPHLFLWGLISTLDSPLIFNFICQLKICYRPFGLIPLLLFLF